MSLLFSASSLCIGQMVYLYPVNGVIVYYGSSLRHSTECGRLRWQAVSSRAYGDPEMQTLDTNRQTPQSV